MALIIRCKKCRRRVPPDKDNCPRCGNTTFRFVVDYWPEGRNGPRVRKALDDSIADKNTAVLFERELMAALRQSRDPGLKEISSAKIACDDLFPEYLEWIRLHRTSATYAEREYTMQTISKIIGDIPVEAINKHHFSLYQQARKAQGVSNKTVNKELYYICSFLRWCRDEKNLRAADIKFKKLPYQRPVPIVLSPAEVQRIVAVVDPFHRAFILCLYSLGLRFSEASHLKWRDIDYKNMSVRCVQKGGSYKILPLNDWLKKALRELPRGGSDSYVFASPRTGQPLTNIKRALATACKRAGVIKHVHPHLFRHSLATHMMGEDINIRKIQTYLGHADIGTTEWYTHVVTGHLKQATKGMFKRMSTHKINNINNIHKKVSTLRRKSQ